MTAVELGSAVTQETIRRSGIAPRDIQEAIFGNARPAGTRPNPARQIAFQAGIPIETPGYTINKACASGLKAITNAYQSILLGDADIILAGGTESMSNAPYLLMKARWGYRLGHERLVDSMYQDGYMCPLCGQIMGETAENLAEQYGISRTEQDEYAAMSQQRCEAARKEGKFYDEIIPIEIQGRKGKKELVQDDEHPRDGVTTEGLSRLKPVFRENGTVHAGNTSGIVDGAASVLVVSEEKTREISSPLMARIVDYTTAGVDPAYMGIGPVPAIRNILERNNMTLKDIDLIELNEAFAVQVLACDRELHFDMDRLNVNGGAIALGHPSGCTGTRIVVSLLHEMDRRKARIGMATLCVSGGLGMALLIERV